jgi:glycosyltransferase involved in cell wall biosynthesis
MTPDIPFTVVVTHLNRGHFIARVMDAVLSQLADLPKGRLLVVDNGSTDGTDRLFDEYKRRHANFDWVVEPRRGVYYARVRGILEAKGEALVFVDDDAILQRGWLAGMMTELFRAPDIGVVGTRVDLMLPPQLPDWLHPKLLNQFAYDGVPYAVRLTEADFPTLPTGVGLAIRLNGCARLFTAPPRVEDYPLGRRAPDPAAGTPGSPLGGEDTDLCLIYRRNGFRVLFADHLRVWLDVPVERMNQEWFLLRYWNEGRTRVRMLRLADEPVGGAHGWRFFVALPVFALLVLFGPLLRQAQALLIRAYLRKSAGAWYELIKGPRLAPFPYQIPVDSPLPPGRS